MNMHRAGSQLILACPCEHWVLVISLADLEDMSPILLRDQVDLTLREHMQECIILTASHIAAMAAKDG
jgi:hypothetical protein